MGDMGDMYRGVDEDKRERKMKSLKENIDILNDSKLNFEYRNWTIMIREAKVSADFYPSSNKWKDNRNKQLVHYGGAVKFIQWVMERSKS